MRIHVGLIVPIYQITSLTYCGPERKWPLLTHSSIFNELQDASRIRRLFQIKNTWCTKVITITNSHRKFRRKYVYFIDRTVPADGLAPPDSCTFTGAAMTNIGSRIYTEPVLEWLTPGPRFNIKMSYQYRKSHWGDKTVVRSSYLHNGISYTGKMSSLYWIGTLEAEWRIYPSVNNASIGSHNGLLSDRRQAIIWNNAGTLLIGPLERNFGEISIEIHASLFKKISLKISSLKLRACCLGLNVLRGKWN